MISLTKLEEITAAMGKVVAATDWAVLASQDWFPSAGSWWRKSRYPALAPNGRSWFKKGER